jgi:hypothetical protein
MMKKKTILLASSVVAVPLAAAIFASLVRKRKLKSPGANITSFPQTSSKGNSFNIATRSGTINRQQKEEELFIEWRNNQEESEPIEVTTAMNATSSTSNTSLTSNNITNEDRNLAPSAALAIVSSSLEPPSSQSPVVEEISVSDEARKSGESLKDLIVEAIKDAKDSAKETGKRLKQQTVDIAARADSTDNQSLQDHSSTLVRIFEAMMTEIRKEPYDRQVRLLESYRDLLQKQSKVVNARGRMASKLKPGS